MLHNQSKDTKGVGIGKNMSILCIIKNAKCIFSIRIWYVLLRGADSRSLLNVSAHMSVESMYQHIYSWAAVLCGDHGEN